VAVLFDLECGVATPLWGRLQARKTKAAMNRRTPNQNSLLLFLWSAAGRPVV
jgi:hypothetical protein